MAKINITFSKSDIIGISNELKYWAGISIPIEDLTSLINKAGSDLKLELAQGSSGEDGLDTGAREQLMDYIGRVLTGNQWPSYGTPHKIKREFFPKLIEACKKRGWKIDEEGFVEYP
jgi:hypothetical protein